MLVRVSGTCLNHQPAFNRGSKKEEEIICKYKVVDAVMGTGKSKWVQLTIQANPPGRYIVVLPTLEQLESYEKKLQNLEGLVSLRKGTAKKERFNSVIMDATTILITHSLFEEYLDGESFELILQGKWKLIMDEVVTAFEPVEVTDIDILGMCTAGALEACAVKPGIELLRHDPKTFQYFKTEKKGTASALHQGVLRESLIKDLYRFTCDSGSSYYTFALQERRLSVFDEVVIMTYPFKNTDLDYWFRIKGIAVDHLNLKRTTKTESLNDFELEAHTGEYSGRRFKHLIEFIEPPVVRGRKRYGLGYYDFSSEAMKTTFNPKKKDKKSLSIRKSVRNDVRSTLRNGRMVEPDGFMFTCGKNAIPSFCDPKHGLPKSFIGNDTFVPFNATATNKLNHKKYLAYLYNVFPFPSIQQAIRAYGLDYDADRWALYILIQWIWRSAIREGEKIYLYLPSRRMRDILEAWLNA